MSFGLYADNNSNDNNKELTDFGEFKKVFTVYLHKEHPKEYKFEMYFDIFAMSEIWERDKKNQLLKAIANDEIRAMFTCPSKQCIISPYDGGVDIIVASSEQRDQLKVKYKAWLSDREDGL